MIFSYHFGPLKLNIGILFLFNILNSLPVCSFNLIKNNLKHISASDVPKITHKRF